MPKIRVLLVDDHALVRGGFRRLLEDDSEIEVAGEATDGVQAERIALETKPDVIVMDYALPGGNGTTVTRKILDALPATRVLMLSMHSEPSYVSQSLGAGASGYLLKSAMDLELADSVKRVARGERVIDPRLSEIESGPGGRRALSPRELEVLQHIVSGKSNKEIAAVLGLSVNTVSVHRANIMDVLGIHNTAELVVYAIRNGLANLP